jgi:uncharacterized protein YggE
MNRNWLSIFGSIFLALLSVAVALQLVQPKPFHFSVTSSDLPQRIFTASGEGKVVVTPDMALVNVGVVTEAKSVQATIKENNDKMAKITASLKELGLDPKDVQTSSYNLYPNYYYPSNEPPVISGYRLDQGLTLKIRDLAKVDSVLGKATELGVNSIYGLSFTLQDDTKVKQEARAKAFEAAKDKASEMADAAGVKIGDILAFSEGGGATPPMPYYAKDMAQGLGGGGYTPEVQAGSQEYTVYVNVTYEIE